MIAKLFPLLAALAGSLLVACQGPPGGAGEIPSGSIRSAEDADAAEAIPPLTRAQNMYAGGDLAGARRAIEEVLAEDEDHAQALYLRARVLAGMGEYRGARSDLQKLLLIQPANVLALDLLASLEEQLGEHRAALERYRQVNLRLRAQSAERAAELAQQGLPVPPGVVSVAPLIAMARCHLVLGETDRSLALLQEARAANGSDAGVEYWRFVVLENLGEQRAAEDAGRNFLRIVSDKSGYLGERREIRRWLAKNSEGLPQEVRALMIQYVRTVCRLRLPGDSSDPENQLLRRAPARLVAFDERPVFVTLLPPGGGRRFCGFGRGRSLAAALKGAMDEIQEHPKWTPVSVRDAAVRIEIGRELVPARFSEQEGRLALDPPLERGHHGIALRAGEREVYLLPCDFPHEDLVGLEEALEFACKRSGVNERAWQDAEVVFRFEAEAFFSSRPGTQPQSLVAGELGPAPSVSLRTLERALDQGVRFLNRQLRVSSPQADDGEDAPLVREGSFPASYAPVTGAASKESASPRSVGLVASISLLLATDERARVLNGASQIVLDRALGLSEPVDLTLLSPPDQAALLDAVTCASQPLRERYQQAARLLADQLAGAPPSARIVAGAALLRRANALRSAADRTQALSLLGDLGNLDLSQPGALRLLVAWVELGGDEGARARQRLEAWAQERITRRGGYTVRDLHGLASAARSAGRHPQAGEFRSAAQAAAEEVLALQIADRHAPFVRDINQATGGFRDDLTRMQLPLGHTAECLLALYEARALLAGEPR